MLVSVGGALRHTSHMIILKNSNDNSEPPYVKYLFVDKKVLEDFGKSRITLDFLTKSQKRKENRDRNINPRRLSRRGYDKLE